MALTAKLLTLLLTGAGGLQPGAPSSVDSQVLWQDGSRAEVRFLPYPVLTERSAYDNPAFERVRQQFDRALAARKAQPPAPGCDLPLIADRGPIVVDSLPPAPPSALDVIRTYEVAFAGKVLRTQPGWLTNQYGGHVASLVTVEVLEVFHDTTGQLQVEGRLTYLQRIGSLAIDAVRLCTYMPPYKPAQIGQLVVVIGLYDKVNRGHIASDLEYVFPVVGDQAFIPPGSPIRMASIPLKALREMSRAEAREPK